MPSSALRWTLLPALLLLLVLPSCSRGPQKVESPDVLIITVDSLRADRPGFAGGEVKTPGMDSLAKISAVFTNAYTTAPEGLPSLASLMTGLYPPSHGARLDSLSRLDDKVETLASALKSRGYVTAALAGALMLHPKFGLARGFDTYTLAFENAPRLTSIDQIGVPGKKVADKALEWLESLQKGQRFFLWVNFFDTHYFHNPPSPFKEEYKDSPYDGEVAMVDEQIQRILSWMKDHDRNRSTIIVLAGNHGEGLGDDGEQYFGILLGESTLRVPLVIHAPGTPSAGLKVDAPVSLADVAPTILDLAGAGVPPQMQGVSLAKSVEGSGKPPTDRPLYFETLMPRRSFGWAPLRGVREGDLKYVEAPGTGWSGLYDLGKDPKGGASVAADHPDETKRLAADTGRIGGTLEGRRPGLSGDLEKTIAALGLPTQPPSTEPFLPAEHVDVGNAALQAKRSIQRGMAQAAILLTKDVLSKDPSNYTALLGSATLMIVSRQPQAAEHQLLTAQADYPSDGEVYHQLGHLTLALHPGEKGLQRARTFFETAAALDPMNEEALYDSACSLAGSDPERALSLLDQAIRNGYRDFGHMAKDPDMNPLRDTARFKLLTGLSPAPGGAPATGAGAPAAPPPGS